MNGRPTAQNTRETGADGDLPGFCNWSNPEHVRELRRTRPAADVLTRKNALVVRR
jgi:hypothetical protein